MRKFFAALLISYLIGLMISCQTSYTVSELDGEEGFKLVWEEDFNRDGVIDSAIWSKIPRDIPAWQLHMSDYHALYDVKDGNLLVL